MFNNSFNRLGDPRMKSRMWQINLNVLQIHKNSTAEGGGGETVLSNFETHGVYRRGHDKQCTEH